MGKKNKVIVKIMDREYTIVSEDSREHMQSVANYVDDKMRETFESNRKLSTSMIGVLTALNIADEFYKVNSEKIELEKRINSPQYELKSARDELNAVVAEFDRRSKAYEQMVQEFLKLIDSSSIYETGISQLKKRMDKLDHQLRDKEEDLNRSKDEVAELEKEFAHREGQLRVIDFED
ncbi:cell division protein ZapA [Fusibacter ferrireducens]|uniref:Cell division protein ZapA n=1 Tax=Fusibacter ferrireducens TaxID=2785058 RepID=A0ABR9ZQW9_9FIRM|nr:cell division protein ZapA [Fusibacter ferrireducens]MBF4692848.1 cell division protein ZapA [Fusibacter ferrireducens]